MSSVKDNKCTHCGSTSCHVLIHKNVTAENYRCAACGMAFMVWGNNNMPHSQRANKLSNEAELARQELLDKYRQIATEHNEIINKSNDNFYRIATTQRSSGHTASNASKNENKAAETYSNAIRHENANCFETAYRLYNEVIAKYPESVEAAHSRSKLGKVNNKPASSVSKSAIQSGIIPSVPIQQGTTNIAVNKRTEQPSNYNNPPPVRGNVDMTSDNAEELFTREYKKLYNTDVAKKAFTNFVGPYSNQKQGLSQDKYTEILLYTLGHELKRISYLEDCLTAIANNKTGSYTTIYSKEEIDKYINNELIKGAQDSIADFIEYAKSFISRFKFSNTYELERYLLLTSATMNITYKMMTELVDNIHVFDYSIINQIFSHNDNSTRNMLNKTALSYSKDLVNSFAHTLNI